MWLHADHLDSNLVIPFTKKMYWNQLNNWTYFIRVSNSLQSCENTRRSKVVVHKHEVVCYPHFNF